MIDFFILSNRLPKPCRGLSVAKVNSLVPVPADSRKITENVAHRVRFEKARAPACTVPVKVSMSQSLDYALPAGRQSV